jgi:hypothetical protein
MSEEAIYPGISLQTQLVSAARFKRVVKPLQKSIMTAPQKLGCHQNGFP